MQELLEKAKNTNVHQLKSYITQVVANELVKLNEPCYAPPYKNYYGEEILYMTGISIKDIRDFVKRFHVERLSKDYLLKEWLTNTLLFTMHFFLVKNDFHGFMTTMILFCINSYSHKFFKFFPFCNPDIFSYSLDRISKTNLMAREKTIANFLYYISKEMIRRYQKDLETFDDPERISRFVYECNHRINQTLRSFAELYHKSAKEGVTGYTKSEKEGIGGETYEVEVFKKGERLINEIVSKLTVYKEIDKSALEQAKKISKINILFAEYIASELRNMKYTNNLKLIYELFIKELKSINQLCGNDFFKYTSSLMGIKRTTQKIYYKQQIAELTEKIILSSKYKDAYNKLTNQTKFLVQSFTSFYLAIFLRNNVCKK